MGEIKIDIKKTYYNLHKKIKTYYFYSGKNDNNVKVIDMYNKIPLKIKPSKAKIILAFFLRAPAIPRPTPVTLRMIRMISMI